MKAEASQKIKTGIFTLVGIALLVVGIFFIGKKQNLFGDTYKIYGTFKNVGGLQIGNNVRFAGIDVGTVENISITNDTTIRVDLRLQSKVKPFLKADALASIGSDGLMGDKLITIVSGSENETKLLTSGSRIITADPVDFDRIIGKFTNVADNAEIITGELAAMAIQIRKGNGTISKLLYTDDLSRSLEGTAANAEKITASLNGIASQIRSGRGSLGSLIYTDSLSSGLENAVGTANTAMITIEEAAKSFDENMKAMQSSFLFRGYFNKKAEEEKNNPDVLQSNGKPVNSTNDPDVAELKQIIAEAQKALDEKQGKNMPVEEEKAKGKKKKNKQ